MLDLLDPKGTAPMLLSGPRAMALGLGNAHDAAGEAGPVEIRHCDWLDRDTARALADPARDFDRGPIGPLDAIPIEEPHCAKAALMLARLAMVEPDGKVSVIRTDRAEEATKEDVDRVRETLRERSA